MTPGTGRGSTGRAACIFGPTAGLNVKTAMLDNVKDAPLKARESLGGWWNNGRQFLSEVRNEMKRVTWPSRKEVYATTVVVILTSLFFGLYLWGVDLALNQIVRRIFQRFGAA